MNKIICIGSACKDVFFPTSEGKITQTPDDLTSKSQIAFELGAKYKIEERFEALGGCAANVASGLAKLGIETSCYSHIGDDLASDWILGELQKNGVSKELVKKENNVVSDMSAIVVDEASADRVIFSNQVANGKLKIISKEIENYPWIFIGDLHGDWEKHLDVIFETAREKNIKVAFNPRQSNIHDNAKFILEKIGGCEILFLNKDEAIEMIMATGDSLSKEELDSEEALLEKLHRSGAKTVTITDGLRGAWAYAGDKVEFTEGRKVEALDSTGAGDAYTSAFLAAYINGKDLAECVRWGIASSSNVVQSYGAIAGLLGEKEILGRV